VAANADFRDNAREISLPGPSCTFLAGSLRASHRQETRHTIAVYKGVCERWEMDKGKRTFAFLSMAAFRNCDPYPIVRQQFLEGLKNIRVIPGHITLDLGIRQQSIKITASHGQSEDIRPV
jgi:hypothetical protein